MINVGYLDLGAAREIEEKTGKNAIDFMDIPDNGETEETEKEPLFCAVIKDIEGTKIKSCQSYNQDMLKNWLCGEIKKLDFSNNCYSFSMYECEQ